MGVDVGLNGRPHDLGNIQLSGKPIRTGRLHRLAGNNFDLSISWKDLEWIRDFWDGPMVIKGISIRKMRAMQYVLVLMGLWFLTTVAASWTVYSSARALPAIADAVKVISPFGG